MVGAARWATFDCYGTLIDWNGGIRRELARLWPAKDADALLADYHEYEPAVQAMDTQATYRHVMTKALELVADSNGLELPDQERTAFPRSLPSWEPFPEVRDALREASDRGWSLAILSNTDRDFIEASMARIGVPFDAAIVASEIGSYKPAHRHWDEFFACTDAASAGHVHVAASLFHDIAPANELGLRSVWINRLDERAKPEPTRELPDLTLLPGTLDELVPA